MGQVAACSGQWGMHAHACCCLHRPVLPQARVHESPLWGPTHSTKPTGCQRPCSATTLPLAPATLQHLFSFVSEQIECELDMGSDEEEDEEDEEVS